MAADLSISDITAFRRKYGFTQYDLADATGLHRGHVSSVEQGLRPVTDHVRERFGSFISFVEDCERNGRL